MCTLHLPNTPLSEEQFTAFRACLREVGVPDPDSFSLVGVNTYPHVVMFWINVCFNDHLDLLEPGRQAIEKALKLLDLFPDGFRLVWREDLGGFQLLDEPAYQQYQSLQEEAMQWEDR